MAKKDTNYDYEALRQVREHGRYLVELHSARNSMFDDMVEMYLLKWDDETKVKSMMENVKLTKHPGARNTILGAIRLMVATDPIFSVPHEDDASEKEVAEKIEKMSEQMWKYAGEARGGPIHYDVVLSALLFSEMHIAITRTSDLVEQAKGGTPAAMARAEEVADSTPYLFEPMDPRVGYPEFSSLGLTSFYQEVETLAGPVLDEFGDMAEGVINPNRRQDKIVLCRHWDYKWRHIYVQGIDKPILQEEHGLPFIPIEVQLGEGSKLFTDPEDQRQPFLYTLWKSGLWSRQNLLLTVLYTMVFGIGSNPMFLYQTNQPGKRIELDFSRPGGVATIESNESFGPMVKNTIDPSILQGVEIADQLAGESTIYPQTLGEPLSGNAPFSMMALLHQAGRLPLIMPQRMGSAAIAGAMKKALMWMKATGKKQSAGYGKQQAELMPSEIPAKFCLEANLDISLPQDMAQMLNVAAGATAGEDPLVSKRFAREEYLKIGQSKEMQKEIWKEKASEMKARLHFLDMQSRIQQLEAMMAAQASGAGQVSGAGQAMGQPTGGQAPPATEQTAVPGQEMAGMDMVTGSAPPVSNPMRVRMGGGLP